MAIKTWVAGEKLNAQDLNDNFGLMYSLKAQNTTSVTTSADSNGTTSSNDTITVSVPAGSVDTYIEIKADVYASAVAYGGGGLPHTASTSIQLYKTYSAADTDLIATRTFNSADCNKNIGGFSYQDTSTNSQTVYYYYEPTADEKANGFDVTLKIYAAAAGTGVGATSSITANFINIMGS